MAPQVISADKLPYGWVEISDAALQRLRRELEQKGQGVVDEMGVLTIHTGYADYFFPGTSVLQTRPRYLFYVCWNLLWLASQRGVTSTNLLRRKDEADLWLTRQLISTKDKWASSGPGGANMDGIIGERVYQDDPPRPPAQRLDFIYWTALHRWGFYRSVKAKERARLFRLWRGAEIQRVGDGLDELRDDAILAEPLAEFLVPPAPQWWQGEELQSLDFELEGEEARWLQERLMALEEVDEGPCLLAKAAELCAELSPLMEGNTETPLRPWDDPLIVHAARAAKQMGRLERASQASCLAHYIRSIYASLVERAVEIAAPPDHVSPRYECRNQLGELTQDRARRDAALALSLEELYTDIPKIPALLRRVLGHVQEGLRRIAAGDEPETVFMNQATHELFETVERKRKGGRARLALTEQGAARRIDYGPDTVGVYDIDYRWNRIRYLLWDIHRGLARA